MMESKVGSARTPDVQATEDVCIFRPVPTSEVDYYFRALRHCRGVTLRRVVEVKPGETWLSGSEQESLALLAPEYSLLTFKGRRSRIDAFEIAVKEEKEKPTKP